MSDLTAHRTLALRVALANNPEAAFLAATHALALKSFYASGRLDGCVEIDVKSAPLGSYASGLADNATARASDEAQAHWQLRLPKKSDDLWDWLVKAVASRWLGFSPFASARVSTLWSLRTNAAQRRWITPIDWPNRSGLI